MNAIAEINIDRPIRDIIYIGTPRQMYKKAIREIAKSCGITEERLMSNRFDQYTSYVRFLCYAELRSNFRFSYPRIAQIMGKEDHTTIIHGIRRLEEIKASGKTPKYKDIIYKNSADIMDKTYKKIQRPTKAQIAQRQDTLIKYLRYNPGKTKMEIVRSFGWTYEQVRSTIRQLIAQGVICEYQQKCNVGRGRSHKKYRLQVIDSDGSEKS